MASHSANQDTWNTSPNLSNNSNTGRNGNGPSSRSHSNSFQSPAVNASMPSRTDSFNSDTGTAAGAKTQHDTQLLEFVGRYRDLQVQRDSYDDLIRDILVHCQGIQTRLQQENDRLARELNDCQLDLVSATTARRDLQQRTAKADAHVDWLALENNRLKNQNTYALVLIDGDGMIFNENLIKHGAEGGKQAAHALRSSLDARLDLPSENTEIIAKIMVNQAGLADALRRSGVVKDATLLADFIAGFNQAKATFDFVDVGTIRGAVSAKLKELTRWHVANYNCIKVALGVAHNGSYASYVNELSNDENIQPRVVLIESLPAHKSIAALHVKTIRADSELFRSQKLVDLPPPPATAAAAVAKGIPASKNKPVTSPPPAPQRAASPEANGNGTGSWATVTSSNTPPPPPPQMTLPLAAFNTKQQNRAKQQHAQATQAAIEKTGDKNGVYQLVPPEQPDWNPGDRGLDEAIMVNVQVYEGVKKRKESDKLCNNHFLRGPCAKGESCFFVHDYKPTPDELKAIAVLARQNPCTMGQYCENEDCIYGHHCPSVRDGVCIHPFCRFEEEQHPPGTKMSKTR